MKRSLFGRTWPNVVAVLLFIGLVFPVYWMFATAFKPTGDIISEDPVWIPFDATFEHFKTAAEADHFWTMVMNSVTVTVLAVVFALIVGLASAFALARMRFKGRRGFIVGFMIAQMAPWEVMTIAIYMLVRDADMLNSLVPLTFFYTIMILPLTLLTLRGFVAAVPRELEEAAMVDGCSRIQAFRRVILPLLAPGLMASSLFGFITAWNEFALVLVINKEAEAKTLPVWLNGFQTVYGDDWGATMAASSMFAIPILVLFVFLQRRAVAGLTDGAVKG
ncbi:carbohydrate ABC transporter permease [Streptomyces aurantiacus]|uniref:Putative Trehalose transport system permease protein SugB n=1 Tax=Streptomyces aurantiacus JA 4570 TaxID=1286094 RepID=S3ZEC0_9ACTN|nr:carbohydrate ABC transporter permease [Streptomyces aurantiacus]EPH40994.1 putative Trehalose transport system permease protein SugB [Streptomyces aurantiacus JA 4570]